MVKAVCGNVRKASKYIDSDGNRRGLRSIDVEKSNSFV